MEKISLIMMSLLATAAAECITDATVARCDDIILTPTSPIYVFGKPQYLHFNQLEGEIPVGVLKNLPQIGEMEIGSGITYIEPGAFEGLKTIRTINLFNNSIRYIVRGTFRGCHSLQQLTLKHNRLNYIEVRAFEELINLRTLDMSENPELGVLRDYTFSGLWSLRVFQCILCGIHNIDPLAFYNTTAIEELILQSNFIGNLNGTALEHLRNLEKLDLTGNDIKYIDVEPLLHNLPNLRHIYLLFNKINCYDITPIETKFQRKNVNVHIRVTDRNNNQFLTCLQVQ